MTAYIVWQIYLWKALLGYPAGVNQWKALLGDRAEEVINALSVHAGNGLRFDSLSVSYFLDSHGSGTVL